MDIFVPSDEIYNVEFNRRFLYFFNNIRYFHWLNEEPEWKSNTSTFKKKKNTFINILKEKRTSVFFNGSSKVKIFLLQVYFIHLSDSKLFFDSLKEYIL